MVNKNYKLKKQYKVAIADDHYLFTSGVKILLENDGFFLVTLIAHNGQELIEKLELSYNFDLILLDITMPILDGIETTKLIRKKWDNSVIVALTMHEDRKTIKQFMDSGGNLLLCKDIPPSELIENLLMIVKKE